MVCVADKTLPSAFKLVHSTALLDLIFFPVGLKVFWQWAAVTATHFYLAISLPKTRHFVEQFFKNHPRCI
jgi:hypothetical protein